MGRKRRDRHPGEQRPFVWQATDVRDPPDSLLLGFPIGYLIARRNPDVKLKDGSRSVGKRILVDCQQRVTTLMAALLGRDVVTRDERTERTRIAFHPGECRFELSNTAVEKSPAWVPDIAALAGQEGGMASLGPFWPLTGGGCGRRIRDDTTPAGGRAMHRPRSLGVRYLAWLILLLGYPGCAYPPRGCEAQDTGHGGDAGLIRPDAGDAAGSGLRDSGPAQAAERGVLGGAAASGWVVAGLWPTYGFAAAQTRSKVNPGAFPDPDPAPAWVLTLPVARHTMFYSSATSGPDGTLYIPFFGIWDYYPSGGIQAVSAAGEPRWYFTSRETEVQSPLVARDRATGETVVIFGSAGRPYGNPLAPDPSRHYPAMMAIYDRTDCRCCVDRDDATSFCEFTCVPDELCEPYDPESRYEWRHMGHVDPLTRQATCEEVNPQCAAWLLSADALDPARVPRSPRFGYYEQCGTPLLAPDGRTVYYSICGVDLLVNLTNLIVAVDVEQKAVKWILTEDDPEGWDRGECASGHNQLGWIECTAMMSDGSLLYGTRAGCLVRIVDYGDHGATEGLYHGPHPSVVGLAVEPAADGDDFIYVASHGQVRQEPGDLYKTARSRLVAQGDLHEPIWAWPVGKALAPDDWGQDAPGLYGSPVVVTTADGTTVYAVAGDWPDQGPSTWLDPDRGWVVKVPGSGPDGSEAQLPLRLDDQWYPAFNCTVDGRGSLWLHGGQNRAVDGSGRILRIDADFSGPVGIAAGLTSRFGFAEIILDRGGLYAISAASWDGDHDDVSPIVYRFGDEAGLPPRPRRIRGRFPP